MKVKLSKAMLIGVANGSCIKIYFELDLIEGEAVGGE